MGGEKRNWNSVSHLGANSPVAKDNKFIVEGPAIPYSPKRKQYQFLELCIEENSCTLAKICKQRHPIVPYSTHQYRHCARLTIESPNIIMAKNYLSTQTLQGFSKFSASTSSDKAYIRLHSNLHKPVKSALQISKKRPISHPKLPLRIKHMKMSSTSSPKRTRRDSDAVERPSKLQRCSSEPCMAYFILPL